MRCYYYEPISDLNNDGEKTEDRNTARNKPVPVPVSTVVSTCCWYPLAAGGTAPAAAAAGTIIPAGTYHTILYVLMLVITVVV